MKNWADYIDQKGLIVGVNPKKEIQLGDTLQRCGMWFLFSWFLLRHKDESFVSTYLQEHFQITNGYEANEKSRMKLKDFICFRFFRMYQACYFNERANRKERYPIRHPSYELEGAGKTSRDQMMSNLWALLVIASSDSKDTERQHWAQCELYNLWDKLKKDFFILPAKDILAPEHLSVFWRLFYLRGDLIEKIIYKPLILLGDFHNYLSTLVKNREAKKNPAHVDDVNRLCMVMGANFVLPTFWSKKSLKTYMLKRPAYFVNGEYYHGKPKDEFTFYPSGNGALYAMTNYCKYQEAPWDKFLQEFIFTLELKASKNENI